MLLGKDFSNLENAIREDGTDVVTNLALGKKMQSRKVT